MSWFSDVCFSLILVNLSSYNILLEVILTVQEAIQAKTTIIYMSILSIVKFRFYQKAEER